MYGYYLAESGVQKQIFEFLQRNLEEKTDALHELIEVEGLEPGMTYRFRVLAVGAVSNASSAPSEPVVAPARHHQVGHQEQHRRREGGMDQVIERRRHRLGRLDVRVRDVDAVPSRKR